MQANVLPTQLSATFDIRLAIDVNHKNVEETIQKWCQEAGDQVRYEFMVQNPRVDTTRIDESNQWWMEFKKQCDKM